jgi:Fe-S cluster assembly ATP-binding protein
LVDLNDGEILDRKLDEKLSGGERKRIELASVIIMKLKLMILDEPDASLDIIVYNELYDMLTNIREEIGCSILLITHREEAGLISDKATFIDGGKVIETGTFRHVMRKYCETMGKRGKCLAGRKASA